MTSAACSVLPEEPGVYRFRDERGRIAYLGRATNLRARVRSYWGDLTDRPHLRRMVTQIAGVEAMVCASTHEAAWLERNLLERSLPRWNRIRGGAETPCWLVVDDSPHRPGLHLAFDPPPEPRTVFGPYLGFERITIAREALLRLYPLQLTGDRPNRAERALAEVRGVLPTHREEFGRRLRAVLGRDPAVVAHAEAELVAARDQAVTRLAFETAQQIQLELAALGWLAAEQRVTACIPPDLRVAGWAEGRLFTLNATGGRLDRWLVREADEAAGLRARAHTPEPWRAFADRNAELAAELASVQSRPEQEGP